jgi:hypothetical protein
MSSGRLKLVLVAVAIGALAIAAAASGRGALVEVDNIVLRADGSFQPRYLPRKSFAPLDFRGYVRVNSKDGSRPVPLRQLVIDFDRDGRLSVKGLPTCAPERVAYASTSEARGLCAGAMVGKGRIEATLALSGGLLGVGSPVSVFNGPPLEGRPTAVIHAHFTEPATQTFAILVPIEKRRGGFRYRATIDIPPIAAGLGSLTLIQVELNRRYSFAGKQRSYTSARCSDNILSTNGRFTFEDGTIIDGAVSKFCRMLPNR